MLGEILENVRSRSLRSRTSPIMSLQTTVPILLWPAVLPQPCQIWEEGSRRWDICDSLNINMGTLHPRSVKAMLLAGKSAGSCGHPIVLDPVGAGASTYRRETAEQLLREIPFTAIRGNISEIKTIAGEKYRSGVRRRCVRCGKQWNLEEAIRFGLISKKTVL